MSMSDEQFELAMCDLEDKGSWHSKGLRARDTAQREALAQMKIERDQYDELHLESIALAARHEQTLARVEAERDKALGLAMHYGEQRNAALGDLAEAVERLAKAEETIARLQSGAVT